MGREGCDGVMESFTCAIGNVLSLLMYLGVVFLIFVTFLIIVLGKDTNKFFESLVDPFVEWWKKNPWDEPARGEVVPQHSPSRYNTNPQVSSHQPLNQTPPPQESRMLINGNPIDHLSQDEKNFLTFAFGKMVDGKPEVTINDPLFQHVERKVNPVSPFLLWPDKLSVVPYRCNNIGIPLFWTFHCNGCGTFACEFPIPDYWMLYPKLADESTCSPEEKIALLNSIVTYSVYSNALALRYLSKDAATAKQLLLANVGKVCKELESGDNRSGSTSWNTYSLPPDNGTPIDTSTKVIVGALLGIGWQELAMGMLLTSGDFQIQGLAQQWIGVFGAKD